MDPHHLKDNAELTETGYVHAIDGLGFRLLGRRQRNLVRQVARQVYLCRPGDQEAAVSEAKKEIESIFITILLGVAIKLAVDLIVHWIQNGITEPESVFQSGEPGAIDE